MSNKSGDLIPQWLGGDKGHFFDDPLVGVEVQRQLGVVLLDDDPGGLLDGLGSNSAHDFCSSLKILQKQRSSLSEHEQEKKES